MPVGIVEGAETMVIYTLCILFPEYLLELYVIFAVGVILTIFFRIYWASKHIV